MIEYGNFVEVRNFFFVVCFIGVDEVGEEVGFVVFELDCCFDVVCVDDWLVVVFVRDVVDFDVEL